MPLPEREWFSIQQLADRWGCSVAYIVHLLEAKKLFAAYRFKYKIKVCPAEFGADNIAKPKSDPIELQIKGLVAIINYVDIIWNSSRIATTDGCVLCRLDNNYKLIQDEYYVSHDDIAPIFFENLIVMKNDVFAFETAHAIETINNDTPIENTKNENMVLSKSGEKIGKNNPKPGPGALKSEINQIIDSLFNQLLDEGKSEFLQPKRVEEFLEILKERSIENLDCVSKEYKLHKDYVSRKYILKEALPTYAELIEFVQPRSKKDAVRLKNPRYVRGDGYKNQSYSQKDIKRRLYELLSKNQEIIPAKN